MRNRLKLGALCVLVLLGFLWAASPAQGRKEAGDLWTLQGSICEEVCWELSMKGLLVMWLAGAREARRKLQQHLCNSCITDGKSHWWCQGQKQACGLQQNTHSSVRYLFWGLMEPDGDQIMSRFFQGGRQAVYQLEDSAYSVARILPLASPKALGQGEDE